MTDISAEDRYSHLVSKLLEDKKVSFPTDRKGFGSGALWISGKMFAFLSSKRQLVVKLPEERKEQLVGSGKGEQCEMGKGRILKQWLALDEKSRFWLSLAIESMQYVESQESLK